MSDWIEHNGGPQPVADDVWVDVGLRDGRYISGVMAGAVRPVSKAWPVDIVRYRILNQHLIDAARLEGIRLGLEAAQSAVEKLHDYRVTDREIAIEEAVALIFGLNPDTIAKEADQ